MSTILQCIAAGDGDAMQECIDTYGGLIWSIARKYLGGRAEAEDAVQDVFVELWKSAGRFDSSLASEKSYVVMLARRRIIDRLRKVGRRLDSASIDDDLVEPASDQHEGIERSVEAQLASRVLDELPPIRKRVIELSLVQGMSHSEIAETTDLPLGTVKSHIARGLAHVRQALLSPEPASGGVH